MKEVLDRVPLYPGRVTLTPVTGQTNTYDMVRADQPSVAGTPLNKELFETISLGKDTIYYVSTAGNDTTGDGSQINPFKTITKAINTLPKDLGGKQGAINVAAGTYNEIIRFYDFSNGAVTILGGNFTCNGILVGRSYVSFSGGEVTANGDTGNGAINVLRDGVLFASNRLIATNAERGFYVEHSGVLMATNITANNISNVAVSAIMGGGIYIGANISGSGNSIGLNAARGGRITYVSSSISATTQYQTLSGGRIYSGAQTSIPNY